MQTSCSPLFPTAGDMIGRLIYGLRTTRGAILAFGMLMATAMPIVGGLAAGGKQTAAKQAAVTAAHVGDMKSAKALPPPDVSARLDKAVQVQSGQDYFKGAIRQVKFTHGVVKPADFIK